MGCNCHNTIRQQKDVMREKAIRYAVNMEVDVQFHTWTQRGFSRLYDFEDFGSVERGRGVIEIIYFRKHKSKNVLQDSKAVVGSKSGAKGNATRPKRIKPKVDRVSGKVANSHELAKKGKGK